MLLVRSKDAVAVDVIAPTEFTYDEAHSTGCRDFGPADPHVDSQAKQPCIGGSDFNLMLVVFIFWCFLVLQLDVKVYLVSPHYTNCMLLIIR
jgi:hypothetical protein